MIREPLKSKLTELARKPAGSFANIRIKDAWTFEGVCFADMSTKICNQIREYLVRHNTRKHIKFSVKFKNDIIVWVIDRRAKAKPVPPPKPNTNPRKYKSIKEYYNANRKQPAV